MIQNNLVLLQNTINKTDLIRLHLLSDGDSLACELPGEIWDRAFPAFPNIRHVTVHALWIHKHALC